MHLNLGIRAHDLTASSIDELCETLSNYNLKHIQLAPVKSFPQDQSSIIEITEQHLIEYHEKLDSHGFCVSILGCYVNLSSWDDGVRDAAIDSFIHCISLAHALNYPLVASETGSVTKGYTLDNYSEEAYLRTLDALQKIMPNAEKYGVRVAIEAGINHPIHTSAKLKRLAEDLNSEYFNIILDVANLMTPENYRSQHEIIDRAFTDYQGRLAALHLKDFDIIDNQIKFVPLGTGLLDLPFLLKKLQHLDSNLPCCLEGTSQKNLENALLTIQDILSNL